MAQRFVWKKGEKELVLDALDEAIAKWSCTADLNEHIGRDREAKNTRLDIDMALRLKERLKEATGRV